MKTFNVYRSFIKAYNKVSEPYWNECTGTLLSCISNMTPKEMKAVIKKQYHAESAKEFPLWFIGDALQGHSPYYCEGYKHFNEENQRDYEIFMEKMTSLMKRHNIAPNGWIKWFASYWK